MLFRSDFLSTEGAEGTLVAPTVSTCLTWAPPTAEEGQPPASRLGSCLMTKVAPLSLLKVGIALDHKVTPHQASWPLASVCSLSHSFIRQSGYEHPLSGGL